MGAGATASAYKAWREDQGARLFVVKLLHRDRSADEEAIRALLNEGEIHSRIPHHPNLPDYGGHGSEGGEHYYAAEFVPGERLKHRLARSGKLPQAEVLAIGCDLLTAFQHILEHGYLYRDVNVGNVIVFTVCLGLADDNTIHFLYRFREELRRGHAVPSAIQRAFLGTGKAIVATSLLLLAGLGVLRLSNFVPTQRFAELTCVTILGNLLGVLLLLPAWLRIAWREPQPQSPIGKTSETASGLTTGAGSDLGPTVTGASPVPTDASG